MAAQQFKLPLIDFTKLEEQGFVHATPEWINARDRVKLALQEIGSFEAIFGETVPVGVRESVIGVVRDVFDLPLPSMKDSVDDLRDKMYYGYVGKSELNRFYQSIGVDDIESDEGVERLCKCMWPQGEPPHSRETIQTYATKISQVEQLIRKMVLESLGCEKYLNEHLGSSRYHFRWNKYEPTGTDDRKLLLNPHTDRSFLGILYQNGVDGLEIQTKDGEWNFVQQQPNSFIVIVGDSFHAWSNGRLRTPMHRVTLGGFDTRYSIGIFALPKPECVVSAPDEVVDTEHPLRYRPFEIGEYFDYSNSSVAQGEPRLKSFCGI
ncbi:hypothetical protein MLD38_019236 [Melastoma candidum]|uniref:Uncharacterized protein n=1 Tax=Melastoma candidum TaxID=119954 RepID=A0ACB9QWD1_9MYRT|nr:hypothetical protein MLD38_019236 [Melastoma candidum]